MKRRLDGWGAELVALREKMRRDRDPDPLIEFFLFVVVITAGYAVARCYLR